MTYNPRYKDKQFQFTSPPEDQMDYLIIWTRETNGTNNSNNVNNSIHSIFCSSYFMNRL